MDDLLAQLPPTFTYSEAMSVGLSRRRLYALRDVGVLESIGHGLYRRSDDLFVDLDLVSIAVRAPRATLCLTSALAEHELTDQIPEEHDVALPRDALRPKLRAPVRWHSFATATFDIGRTQKALDEQTAIGLYDAPRSIIDSYRLRHEVGVEVAHEALRRWLRQGGQPAQLLATATMFPRALPAVRQALEVLL